MNLVEKSIGDFKLSSLEFRLFNSITLVNGILNILGSFFTLHLQNYMVLFTITFGSGLLFLFMYILSRFFDLTEKLYWPFNLILILFLGFNWFTNSGSTGGAHYYFISALMISTILLRNQKILIVYTIYIIVIGLLFFGEIYYPMYVTNYSSSDERYSDIIPNFIFVLVLNGILIYILIRNLNLERRKSESLLLNILPEIIAEELKKRDSVKPIRYDSVSVMFSDMVGFTKVAETMSPETLIQELHFIFSQFDDIVKKHNLEKIKTIGDSYMCVAGIPTVSKSHAIDSVLCGLEMMQLMIDLKEKRSSENKKFWEFRLGIHSGEIIAGVVGKNKFAYDIWGDTVNTASRLESSGIAGKVNISQSTYEMIHEFFECESRGKVEAKNKGEIEMYFVKGLKQEFRKNGDLLVPNEKYIQKKKDLENEDVSGLRNSM